MRQNSFYGRKLFFALYIVALFSFGGCQHFQENLDASPRAVKDTKRAVAKEARTVSEAYGFILDNYINPLEADQLIVNALLGMQGFIGKNRLSFKRDGMGFTIFSSGETIQVKRISDKRQGAKEIGRIYSFVTVTNPQYNGLSLSYAALKEMVRMDDSSDFMPPEDFKQAQRETQGQSVGIGLDVRIRKEGERVRVVAPVEQSPACRAGILPGDQVLMIDGKATKEMSRDEIYGLLRGQKDNEVTLTILRKGVSEPLVFRMTPEVIIWRNIRSKLLDGGYAYINIARFGTKTAIDFDQAIKEMMNEEDKGTLKGLILDLRDNPGGILSEVLEIANRFVKSGIIVSIEGRQKTTKFNSGNKGAVLEYPTVVLVNGDTSAGAEIVTGVLQDYGRATVVGTSTSGDVSIQTVFPLADGSGLRVTTHVWRLPLGRSIQKTGIVPDFDIGTEDGDLEIKRDVERDKAVRIAIQLLNKASGSKKDLKTAPFQVTPNNP
jgi:carboxyl-terminal processing protease